ncbi:MAG: DUF924 domain-containing protein [Arenicella sp.]|nr:DUF924 domain-containing protein [Arenicella sp.]
MHNEIIEFWFIEIDKVQRFKKDERFDELIRSRFSEIHTQASKCELFSWRSTALGCLAEVIVLDQFSRNMYRGKAESFVHDSLALSLAQSAISKGLDLELTSEQKSFLYMPFMHSESLIIHGQAMTLFTNLGIESNLNFEIKHKSIIERFGRYPHRNKILGRASSSEENSFLLQPGSGF